MKLQSIVRLGVIGCAVCGSVIVVTSQPGKPGAQQGDGWPTHTIMPKHVSMSGAPGDIQEFKDAATLHLNDIQKAMMGGYLGKFPPQRYVVIETVWRGVIDTKIYKSDPIPTAAKGGGTPSHQITPAELAILYYTFDKGVDMISNSGAASSSKAEVTPNGITAKITPKDVGMTADQLKAMTMNYIDSHQMRFWNEARVGLASGR